MSGFAGRGRRLTVGLAIAVAGSGVALAPGAQAAAKYQNGVIGWAVDKPYWKVSSPDGTDYRDVTPSGGGFNAYAIDSISYSPDGTRAAFIANANTASYPIFQLWVSKADGTGAKKIADISWALMTLAWAPDGSAVYYSAPDNPYSTGSDADQIFVAPIDGSAAHTLFSTPTGYWDTDPTVSADGRVAFVRTRNNGTPTVGVFVLAPGASTPQLIPGTTAATHPIFSPNGGKIAMGLLGTNPGYTTVIMNVDGSAATQVAAGSDYEAWSPDSSELAWGRTGDEIAVTSTAPGSVPHSFPADYIHAPLTWRVGKSNVGPRPVLDRVGGADRRGTAIAASQWSYDAVWHGGRQANVAVLSRDDQFADALSGNALAAQKRGPLLLTGTAALDGQVKAELQRILVPGSTVYILGGEQALSPAVEQAVKDAGFTPKRLQGPDRYSTSVAIAKEIAPNGPHSALVATGTLFPDALTAGAAAAQDLAGGVVLLSRDGVLPQVTTDYLASLDWHQTTVYGVGGQGVAALKSTFPQWNSLTVPLAGADRYGTAYQVAHSKLFGLDKPVSIAGIATGSLWPDALSGGALIAAQHGPLLLAGPDGLSAPETSVLTSNHLTGLAVFGGTKAVADSIADAAANTAFGAGAWDPATDRQAPALP